LEEEKLRFSSGANSFFSQNGDSSISGQIRRRQHSAHALIVFFFQQAQVLGSQTL